MLAKSRDEGGFAGCGVLVMIRSTAGTSALDILSLSSLPWCQQQPHLSGCQARGLAAFGKRPHLRVMMLDLNDQETDALAGLLRRTIDDDRYPLSPRLQLLKAILAKIRPEPVHEPLSPPMQYAPPHSTTARRRRAGRQP
jgi:hypothetical protein